MKLKLVLLFCALALFVLSSHAHPLTQQYEAAISPFPPKKFFAVVEVPATSHVTIMLPILKELVAKNHTVLFACADVYADLLKRTDPRIQHVPLSVPKISHEAFHFEYTKADGVIDAKFLFRMLSQTWPASYPTVFKTLQEHRDVDCIFADFFAYATSDIHRYRLGATPPPLLVSIPTGLGVFGIGAVAGLPTGLAAQISAYDRSFSARLADLVKLVEAIFLTTDAVNQLNAVRAKENLPPLADPTEIVRDRPMITAQYWDIDYGRRLPPYIRPIGHMLTEKRELTAADMADLQLLDRWHQEGRQVVYVAFGSISFPTLATLSMLVKGAREADTSVLLVLKQSQLEAWRSQLVEAAGGDSFIHFSTWTNQRAVLEHPAVRVFITHGGAQSLVESCAAGVPLLVLPFYGDQPANTAKIVDRHIGFALTQYSTNSSQVAQKVTTLLQDPSYSRAAFRLEEMRRLRNPPARGAEFLEEIAYFGFEHLLDSTESQNIIQKYNLDILAIPIIIVFSIFYVILRLLISLLRKPFSKSKKD